MSHIHLLSELGRQPDGAPRVPQYPSRLSYRQTYRIRPPEELEEATWPEDGTQGGQLVTPSKIRLRSYTSSQGQGAVTFRNTTNLHVMILWLDFKGNEVFYGNLPPAPQQAQLQQQQPQQAQPQQAQPQQAQQQQQQSLWEGSSFRTHPWIVREWTTGARLMLQQRMVHVVRGPEPELVDVCLPPRLHWTSESHCCFPEPFKHSAHALLLAHKRLERVVAGAHAAPAAAAAAPTAGLAGVAQQQLAPAAPQAPARHTKGSGRPHLPCQIEQQQQQQVKQLHPATPLHFSQWPAAATATAEPAATARGDSPATWTGAAAASSEALGPSNRLLSSARALLSSLLTPFTPFSMEDSSSSSSSSSGRRERHHTQQGGAYEVLGLSQHMGRTGSGAGMQGASGQEDDAAWPLQGTHLGHLPLPVVMHIIELLGNEQFALANMHHTAPAGRQHIQPALLVGPPPNNQQPVAPAVGVMAGLH